MREYLLGLILCGVVSGCAAFGYRRRNCAFLGAMTGIVLLWNLILWGWLYPQGIWGELAVLTFSGYGLGASVVGVLFCVRRKKRDGSG